MPERILEICSDSERDERSRAREWGKSDRRRQEERENIAKLKGVAAVGQ